MTTPFNFWTRIDSLLKKKTLVTLAEETGLNYGTMKKRRSLNRFPSLEDCYILAKNLDTTMEYLLTGEMEQLYCPEAKAVQNDPNLQALIRAVQKDPHLVHVIGSVIVSTEKQIMDA